MIRPYLPRVRVPKSHLAYTCTGSFIVCTFVLQWFQQSSYGHAPHVLLLIGWILLYIKRYTTLQYITAGCVGVSLALLCVARTTHVPTETTIDTFAREEFVTLQGVIAAEPDRRPMQTKYTVEVSQLEVGSGRWVDVSGRILATDKRQWPEFKYGDAVTVRGTLEKPGLIDTFHYDKYLSRFNIYAVIYRASLASLDSLASSASFPRMLFQMKHTFESHTNKLYSEPHASFMAGLLTGSRRGIPEKLMEEFNVTGLTHIIAISGYNITIVITVISGLLFWLPLRWRFGPAVIAIIAFTLFVGASPAVVRASIMGILGLMALQSGRQSHTRLAVMWTLVGMLLWNPKFLWYDAGFQLSFLAVVGLMELGPLLDPLFARVTTVLGIRESLQMTIAAQLSAVPLIVLLFGRLSLIAPIANLLVAPAIPIAMLFGFVATIISYVSVNLALLPAYIGWAALEWVVLVSHYLSRVPLASVDMPEMNVWVIVGYYFGLSFLVYWHTQYNR